MDNRHGAAENPQTNTHLQAEGVGRESMDECRVGQVHDIHECITCLPHVDLRWREAEHARVLARLRASRQVADEAYLRLLCPDLLNEVTALLGRSPDPEEHVLTEWAYQGLGDARPPFVTGLPHLSVADADVYRGLDFDLRLLPGHWAHQQPYLDEPIDPKTGLPFGPRHLQTIQRPLVRGNGASTDGGGNEPPGKTHE